MHEYLIEVLTKVSFDRSLFLKELNKSKRWLTAEEWEVLYGWAEDNYKHLLRVNMYAFDSSEKKMPAC
jgi:hypothetical protein